MKYKLADSVYYRQYDDNVLLVNTSNREVYILNASCKFILDCFKDWCSIEDAIAYINKGFMLDESDVQSISAYIEEMIQSSVLLSKNTLSENKNDIISTFKTDYLPDNQLFAVQFELTFRCNEKCKHCYCIVDKARQELTTEEIKKILDDLYDMNCFEVTFTGGDPFVRSDTFEILKYAKSKGFLITIFTNGNLLSDSDLLFIKSLDIKAIHFSVYSDKPEKHDEFTQVPGSWQKTINAIKKCVMLGIPTNIKICTLDWNINDIGGILKLAEDLGTTAQVSLSITPKNDGDMSPTNLRLKAIEDYAKVMMDVNEHIEIHCSNDYTKLRPDNGAICGAGRNSLNISPYGDVYPCNSFLYKCGNLREQSIKDIWETSDVLKKVRGYTIDKVKGCKGCPELRYCNFCPGSAFLEKGDPLIKYDEACILAQAKKLANKKGGYGNEKV